MKKTRRSKYPSSRRKCISLIKTLRKQVLDLERAEAATIEYYRKVFNCYTDPIHNKPHTHASAPIYGLCTLQNGSPSVLILPINNKEGLMFLERQKKIYLDGLNKAIKIFRKDFL